MPTTLANIFVNQNISFETYYNINVMNNFIHPGSNKLVLSELLTIFVLQDLLSHHPYNECLLHKENHIIIIVMFKIITSKIISCFNFDFNNFHKAWQNIFWHIICMRPMIYSCNYTIIFIIFLCLKPPLEVSCSIYPTMHKYIIMHNLYHIYIFSHSLSGMSMQSQCLSQVTFSSKNFSLFIITIVITIIILAFRTPTFIGQPLVFI